MGYRHSSDEIVRAAADATLEHGIGGLTYRRVAERLGTSDRMIVYYLPTKADLVRAAATALSVDVQALLAEAFGDARRTDDELVRMAWPVLSTPQADRVFAVFLEIIGLSAAGHAPYDQIAPALLGGWADWLAERVDAPTGEARRRIALGVIARVDGLLLVRHTMGAEAGDAAARALGISRGRSGRRP